MSFPTPFDSFVCDGDTISCETGHFEVTARIVYDDSADKPDENSDGFWPSLNPEDAGFIGQGANMRARFDAQQAKAEAIMTAWTNEEWFYCGIVLSVSVQGITLEDHAASLWGIEANYPNSDNAYLTDVANELLPEALDMARKTLDRLFTAEPTKREDDIVFRRFSRNADGWIGAVKNVRLVGHGKTSFAAIFDADASPIIIERRAPDQTGWHQVTHEHKELEEISALLTLLWDDVMLEPQT